MDDVVGVTGEQLFEGDAGLVSLAGAPDDLVGLDVITGPHAAITEDAGLVIHGDDRGRIIGRPAVPRGQRERGFFRDAVAPGQGFKVAVAGAALAVAGGGVIGHEQTSPRPLILETVTADSLDG